MKSFDEILDHKSKEEALAHDAAMLSFRFISEINKIMLEKGMSKKMLASQVGISPSYVTQLFNGGKLVNCEILARFQKILNITFEIATAVGQPDRSQPIIASKSGEYTSFATSMPLSAVAEPVHNNYKTKRQTNKK